MSLLQQRRDMGARLMDARKTIINEGSGADGLGNALGNNLQILGAAALRFGVCGNFVVV